MKEYRGVNGLAVLFIVLFHFWPNAFPNGYLGVDLYFVVSGYFICKSLKNLEDQNKSMAFLIFGFYSNRFQKILPLYMFSIMITLLGVVWLLSNPSFQSAKNPALKALGLITNQFTRGDESYFEETSSALDFFTHTWSICVEVQFTLLIPLLYLDISAFKSSNTQLFLLASLAVLSYTFYVFCSPVTGFYSVVARIWQFVIGMIMFRIKNNDYEQVKCIKPYKFVFVGILIYTATYSTHWPELITRSLFTMVCGIMVLVSSNDIFFSNPILVYVGKLSFSLYLFHWPVYVYCQSQWANNQIANLLCLIFAVLLSVVVHETFEKFLKMLSALETWSVIALLVFINLSAIYKDEILNNNNWDALDNDKSYSLETPEEMNRIWSQKSWSQLKIPETAKWSGWNYRKSLPLGGTEKIVIFGNSLAANIGKTIHEECQQKSKSVLQGTYFACEPLYPTSSGPKCSSVLDSFERNIKKEQPDYAFLAARHLDMGKPPPLGVDKLEHDPVYIFAKQQLANYTRNIKKKLFIVMPFPKVHSAKVGKIALWMKENRHPEEMDRMLNDREGFEMAKIRYEKLIEECGEKCVPVDFRQEFLDEESKNFRFFNFLGFSYLTSDNNFTPLGLVRIRHILREICKSL